MATKPIYTAFPIQNGYAPTESPKALPLVLDFSTESIYGEKFYRENATGIIEFFQAVWIDNTANANPVYVRMIGGTQQVIKCEAGSHGAFPIFATLPQNFEFETTPDSGLKVTFIFLNVPIAPYQHGPITVNATVTPVARGTYTDRSGTITTGGTSQVLMAVNANRLGYLIQNPSSNIESIFVNFTDPATGAGDSIEIAPGGSLPSNLAFSTEAINIVAATTGTAFVAKELA